MIRNFIRRLILRWLPASVAADLPEDRVQLALMRGRRAADLLADDVLAEAFGEIESKLSSEWRDSASMSHEKREVLFHQVAAIQSVKAQLKRWSEDAVYFADRIEKAGR